MANKDDERIVDHIIQILEYYKRNRNDVTKAFIDQDIAWLKKQRINTEGDFARGYDCGYECCLNSHGAEWFEKQKEQSFTHHEIDESLRDAVTRQMEDDGDVDDFVRRGIDDIVLKYAALGAERLEKQKEPHYSPLCNTIKDKIREYIANHFITDTVVKTDVRSIVKAMEEGVRLGKEEQKERKPAEDWKETRKKECPFRRKLDNNLYGCERYADVVCECTGNCSWVVDYPKLKEIQDRKERKSAEWSGPKEFISDTISMRLKSLHAQPQQEWSEEDEDTYNQVYYLFRDARDEWYKAVFSGCYPKITRDKVLSMLKSLKPQWKPSEEQIEALEKTTRFANFGTDAKRRNALLSLYERLKKL